MQSRRLIFFLKIWVVAFATTLYFAQASIAQSPEQRLIRLVKPVDAKDADAEPTIHFRNEMPLEKEQILPLQDFVVYGRAKEPIDVGIAPRVEYRPILYAREPELIPDLEFPEPKNRKKRNLDRMPDLESFFTFGGTLELLTPTNAPSKNSTSSSANSCGVSIQGLKIPLSI